MLFAREEDGGGGDEKNQKDDGTGRGTVGQEEVEEDAKRVADCRKLQKNLMESLETNGERIIALSGIINSLLVLVVAADEGGGGGG